jgi:nicotinamidase-related amidase
LAHNEGEERILRRRLASVLATVAALFLCAAPAPAQTIIDQWSGITAPPPPELKPVSVEPKVTALLMLDFLAKNCAPNPRCTAALPKVSILLAAARAKGFAVVYSDYPSGGEVVPEVARQGSEPLITAVLDKFALTSKDGTKETGLDRMLKDKGVSSVIVLGNASNGAVLYTATSAFFRGYRTIVPLDGVSATTPYAEQEVANIFASAPVIGGKITLTRIDMINF